MVGETREQSSRSRILQAMTAKEIDILGKYLMITGAT